MDDAVDHFMAFTGAGADVARRYLGLTENNSEQAIQLFFDSPELASGLDQQPEPSAPPIPTSTRPQTEATSAGRATPKGAIEITSDDDDEVMDFDEDDNDEEASDRAAAAAAAQAADLEDDEAIARRMQEELYAGGDASGGFDADGVRAPIGRRTETLVGGPDGDWPPADMHAAVLQQMRNRQSRGMPRSQSNLAQR
jgi:UBX domain-containing protein 7